MRGETWKLSLVEDPGAKQIKKGFDTVFEQNRRALPLNAVDVKSHVIAGDGISGDEGEMNFLVVVLTVIIVPSCVRRKTKSFVEPVETEEMILGDEVKPMKKKSWLSI